MSIGGLNGAISSIAASYNSAQAGMSKALARLGTQQRNQNLSDDTTAFTRVGQLKTNEAVYEKHIGGLQRGKAFLETADSWATAMSEQLTALKEAYASGDTSAQTGIQNAITDAAKATYNGKLLVTGNLSYEKVTYAEGTAAVTLKAGAAAFDPTDLGTEAKVDTAIAALNTFAGTIAQFKSTVDASYDYATSMLSNARSAQSTITAIDEAAELAQYTKYDIQQQAAASMVSQGAMSSRAVLGLYR